MTSDLEKVKTSKVTLYFSFMIILVATTLLLLLMIELGFYLLIDVGKNKKQPFFIYNSAIPAKVKTGAALYLDQIDPLLGYGWNLSTIFQKGEMVWPGFVVNGNIQKSGVRIVTLGGSTTDAFDPHNWPTQLYEILQKKHKVSVINGGTSGYSSSQELLKLIRDAIPIAPDIVIAMNGVNDLGFIQSVNKTPMTHNYQQRFAQNIGLVANDNPKWSAFMPNTLYYFNKSKLKDSGKHGIFPAAKGFTKGVIYAADPVDNWYKNIRTSKAVADAFGIKYVVFLQPILGGNIERTLGPKDAELMDYISSKRVSQLSKLKYFYEKASILCAKITYCVDIHNIFPSDSDMYRDPRHPNEVGYGLIANRVLAEISNRDMLVERKKVNTKIPFYADSIDWYSSYFLSWKRKEVFVKARDAIAPNGLLQADSISFSSKKSYMYQAKNLPVKHNDTLTGSVVLWSDVPTKVLIQVARHCSGLKFEATSKIIKLTNKPIRYEVSHTFNNAHDCSRLTLKSTGDSNLFYAWNAELKFE